VLCVAVGWYMVGLPPFGGGGQKQHEAEQKPLQIRAAQVQQVSLPVESDYTGVVVSPRDTESQARVSGYVMERPFMPGSTVKKGDVLFRIDPRPFSVSLAQAAGNQQDAQAQVAFYKAEVTRYKPLARRGFASQERLQTAQRNLDQAEGQVQVATAKIAQQELNLQYAIVRAPYAGRTGVTNVNVGDLVSANQTNLVRLVQMDPIEIQVAMSERDAKATADALRTGSRPVLQLDSPDGKSRPRTAKIDIMDNQFNTATNSLLVRAAIDNPDGSLVPGAFIHVRLELGEKEELVVPTDALTAQLDQHLVYVIKNNKAHMQQVETGDQHGDNTVVTKGLSAGQLIAIDHLQKLGDGDRVQVKPVRQQTGETGTAETGHGRSAS
jgi:RND family efflux transporter MFP subunit